MYIERIADINTKLKKKSLFLFGPRQTGKSSYIRAQLDRPALSWTLLDSDIYRNLTRRPSMLRSTLKAEDITDGVVVIDEIQLLPELLNEIHLMIEESNIHFLLTGSSARQIKRKGGNLLGGRASYISFHPLVHPEISTFDRSLESILNTGLLPSAFNSEDPDDLLSDYVSEYVKAEIENERIVRDLPPFWEFLRIAATYSGEITNFENVARDIGISGVSVKDWYNILTDTLIGFEVPPYRKTKIRKSNATSKFYLFDTGVTRKLQGLKLIEVGTSEGGRYFENYIASELRAFLDYTGSYREGLNYWHAQSGQEVDFILKEVVAIEVKTTRCHTKGDLKGLRALKEEGLMEKYILVCQEDFPQLSDDGILILPFKEFLERLWNGRIV